MLFPVASRAEHLKILLMLQHFNFGLRQEDGLNNVIYIQTVTLQKARVNSVLILQLPNKKPNSSACIGKKYFPKG